MSSFYLLQYFTSLPLLWYIHDIYTLYRRRTGHSCGSFSRSDARSVILLLYLQARLLRGVWLGAEECCSPPPSACCPSPAQWIPPGQKAVGGCAAQGGVISVTEMLHAGSPQLARHGHAATRYRSHCSGLVTAAGQLLLYGFAFCHWIFWCTGLAKLYFLSSPWLPWQQMLCPWKNL